MSFDLSLPLSSAEFKALRTSMGVTAAWVAGRLGVATNSVLRWERDRTPDKQAVRFLLELKMRFDGEVEWYDERAGEPDPFGRRESRFILIPRHNSDDPERIPIGWHLMVAQRVRERHPDVRVMFDDGAEA